MNDLMDRLESGKQKLFRLGLTRIANDIADAQAEIIRLSAPPLDKQDVCPCGFKEDE